MSDSAAVTELYIGLMSGTSLDGVDGVLVDFSASKLRVVQHLSAPFAISLKAELMALNTSGDNELHRAALASNALAQVYAQVVADLLHTTQTPASAVQAIGVHGQTVRHRPGEFDDIGYTLQLNNPALLSELCGIDVVADFRTRDVAAGGQGAPLVPAFHRDVFGSAQTTGAKEAAEATVQVLNIGGIANVSVLGADGSVLGFDCGPGNALMDFWCQQHTGQPFDAGGAWAASGRVLPALLAQLMAEPYFAKAPPKSTGRDLFNPPWLAHHLVDFADAQPVEVQATLTEFTAAACSVCVGSYVNNSNLNDAHLNGAATSAPLIVCGGGALNTYLMQRLQAHLPAHHVASSAHWGLPPLEVEATAFAWLARRRVRRETGNLKSVTGARGTRILGALYPA